MSKQCKIVDPELPSTSSISADFDWKECIFCQEQTKENLQCPAYSKRSDLDVGTGYKTLETILERCQLIEWFPIPIRLERARPLKISDESSDNRIQGIVLAELVVYIEESRIDSDVIPIFKLADLMRMYTFRIEQFGLDISVRVHSTDLKNRVLAAIPDLQAHKQGRDVLLLFNDDVGAAIKLATRTNYDDEAMILYKAAQIHPVPGNVGVERLTIPIDSTVSKRENLKPLPKAYTIVPPVVLPKETCRNTNGSWSDD
ncbi:unnamed protein product [Mytilus edulis]|uniref:Uncharacterized protein n=1 Tax=Mytilus edulis TaxID=6550 RepID=A0A8S3S7D6_MYTED|nr:unnamed protein product [Mytilus edulis]